MPDIGFFFNDVSKYHVRTVVALQSLLRFLPDDVGVALSCYHSAGVETTRVIADAFERVEYVDLQQELRLRDLEGLDGYFQEAWLGDFVDWETTIVLDVDTLVIRSLDSLVQEARNRQFLVSSTPWLKLNMIEERLEPWRDVSCVEEGRCPIAVVTRSLPSMAPSVAA